MSEFEKAQCTCSHGYTCRAMTDPNCCAHSCDYNDLVDALNVIKLQRDALAVSLSAYEKILSELVTTDGLICSTSRWYYSERYAELSELSPQQHLAAHDAEVAKKAVQSALRMYGSTDLSNKEIIALSENYAAILNK